MNEATFKEIEKQREKRFGKRQMDDPEVAKFFNEIDEDNERQEREKKAACEFFILVKSSVCDFMFSRQEAAAESIAM